MTGTRKPPDTSADDDDVANQCDHRESAIIRAIQDEQSILGRSAAEADTSIEYCGYQERRNEQRRHRRASGQTCSSSYICRRDAGLVPMSGRSAAKNTCTYDECHTQARFQHLGVVKAGCQPDLARHCRIGLNCPGHPYKNGHLGR